MLNSCVASSSSGCRAIASAIASRQADIVGDHRAVTCGSDLLQGQPHLEGTEAARVLRAIVDIVCRVLLEVIVGRVVREGGAQRVLIAHQCASGLERRIEPLVRIDRYGIGQGQPVQIIGRIGKCRRKAAVGAIDVKPHTVLPCRPR